MKVLFLSAIVLASGLIHANAADKELPLQTDEKFIVKAVESTVAEVKLAESAIKHAANAEVKQLAQNLKDEHTKCLKKLMDQAAKHKLVVVEGLSKDDKETASRLAMLKGNAFDQEYVRGVIERHEKAITTCNAQIKDGKNDEITSSCKEDLPKLKKHLEAARKVQADIK